MISRISLMILLVSVCGVASFGDEAVKKAEPAGAKVVKTKEQSEKEFSEILTGSQLVGYFTTDGEPQDKPLKGDRYSLAVVKKVEGGDDLWLMTYIYKNTTLPLVLPVKWAGTTPVITLDDLTIPGLGTFSARVMFHGDRYAGTWQHGEKGGLMFGRVERRKPAEPKVDTTK